MYDYGTAREMYADAPLGVELQKQIAKARKQELIGLILSYSKEYTEEDLKKKRLPTLESIWEKI